MSKKILIHSIVFSPDGVSTAYLYNDIALKLKAVGYEVAVLTTTPHYNVVESELKKQPLTKRCFGLYYESDFCGIRVKHIYQKKYKSTPLRLLGFLYWHILSFLLGICEKRIDIILSPSPPLTIGLINILIGKLKRAKVIYNVQEIYPDILMNENGLKYKPIISFLKWMEKFVYNHSDAITTIDEIFYSTIAPRIKNKSNLHIIPNFVDTHIYKQIPDNEMAIDTTLFPNTENIKLMYAGNIGIAQDWQPLIALAEELRNEPFDFFVIGEGAMRDFVEKEIKDRQLKNIHLIPYQPRELMPQLLAYSDLQFIFMSKQMERQGFPSKVYTIMACEKPILVSSGNDTPIINFLREKNCAYLITESEEKAKVSQMAYILRKTTKQELKNIGKKGLSHILANYSKEVVTLKYAQLIDKLLR